MQLCKLRFTLPVSFDPLYFVAEEEYLTTNLQTWNGDFFFLHVPEKYAEQA